MVANFNKKINNPDPNKVFFQMTAILFLVIVLILLLADFKMYQKKTELKQEISIYEKKIEDIKKSTQTLKEEIANSGSKDYLEKIAYEQGMARPGEKQVIFVNAPEKGNLKAEMPKSFWGKFTGWFGEAWSWIKNKF